MAEDTIRPNSGGTVNPNAYFFKGMRSAGASLPKDPVISLRNQAVNRALLRMMGAKAGAYIAATTAGTTAASAMLSIQQARQVAAMRQKLISLATNMELKNGAAPLEEEELIHAWREQGDLSLVEIGAENFDNLHDEEMAQGATVADLQLTNEVNEGKNKIEEGGQFQENTQNISKLSDSVGMPGAEIAPDQVQPKVVLGLADKAGQGMQRVGDRFNRASESVGKLGSSVEKGSNFLGKGLHAAGTIAGGGGTKVGAALQKVGDGVKTGGKSAAANLKKASGALNSAGDKLNEKGEQVSGFSRVGEYFKNKVKEKIKDIKNLAGEVIVALFNLSKTKAVIIETGGLSLIATYILGNLALGSSKMAWWWKIVIISLDFFALLSVFTLIVTWILIACVGGVDLEVCKSFGL